MVSRYVKFGVVMGPRKTGTTSLYGLLKHHPMINYSKDHKEIHVFDSPGISESEFNSLYGGNSRRCFVDVGSHYLNDRDAVRKMLSFHGFSGVFVIVRHPFDRFVSHFCHLVRVQGLANLNVHEVIKRFPELLSDSDYEAGISLLEQELGKSRVCLLRFEDLETDPRMVLAKIYKFISGADYHPSLFGDGQYVRPVVLNKGYLPRLSCIYRLIRLVGAKVKFIVPRFLFLRVKDFIVEKWPKEDSEALKRFIRHEIDGNSDLKNFLDRQVAYLRLRGFEFKEKS